MNRCCATTKSGKRCTLKTVFLENDERAIVCRSHLYSKNMPATMKEQITKSLTPSSLALYHAHLPPHLKIKEHVEKNRGQSVRRNLCNWWFKAKEV